MARVRAVAVPTAYRTPMYSEKKQSIALVIERERTKQEVPTSNGDVKRNAYVKLPSSVTSVT